MYLIDKVSAAAVSMPPFTINQQAANLTWGGIVGLIITWAGTAAVLVAFIYLLISGFLYLTAGGNAEQAKKGMQGILNAAIGLIIIALSWVILNAIVTMFGSNSV